MSERIISLEEFENLSEKLFKKIPKESLDMILAIGRGGLVLGRYASDYLEKDMAVIMAKRYKKGKKESENQRVNFGKISATRPVEGRILLIDDLFDEGITMEKIIYKMKKLGIADVKTAALFAKPWSKVKPDYFVEETEDWIVFPYEKHEFNKE